MAKADRTFIVGRYRLDVIPEFEGPRMPPSAMFTRTAPERLEHLLDRVPPGSYDRNRLIPCYGHSPGMLLVEISGAPGAIVGGDPLHHPLQVLDPDVNTGFCEQPKEAARSRRNFLARCADEGLIIAPTHFHTPRFSQVRRTDSGFDLAK